MAEQNWNRIEDALVTGTPQLLQTPVKEYLAAV